MKNIENKKVAVIGLGSMGKKIAELLQPHYNVVVWNRTAAKAEGLTGIEMAFTAQNAIANTDVVIVCVYNYGAIKEVLNSIGNKNVFAGKTLINFTTTSPEEAVELKGLVGGYGGTVIDGALQVAPDQMGLEETSILLSGKGADFEQQKDLLRVLGGKLRYLGDGADAASTVDMATLSWLYGSYIGMIYATELCVRRGVALSEFSDILKDVIPGFIAFFQHQVDTINRGDFTITQSPLSISVSAVEHINLAFEKQGIPNGFWKSIKDLFAQAEKLGLQDKELASIINVLRR